MSALLWAWLLVSLAGLCLSLYLSNASRLDLRALGARANGRRRVAWSRLVRESMRVIVHARYNVAALIAGDLIGPDRSDDVNTTVIVSILMWGNIAMFINSLIDARTRPLLYSTRDGEATIPGGGE